MPEIKRATPLANPVLNQVHDQQKPAEEPASARERPNSALDLKSRAGKPEGAASAPRAKLQAAINTVRADVHKQILKEQISSARERDDAMTYKKVFTMIEQRYKEFDQHAQTGFEGKAGVTGDIADIKTGDLISILRHIATNDGRRADAAKKSAVSPLFDKIYLMENKAQGWNLRLHEFAPGGGAQGDEELPHFHRWTLASKILLGGYNNKNYAEIPASEATPDEHLFKYQLNPSPAGKTERELVPLGDVGMRNTANTLFKQGELRHFPVELPHSVSDLSTHTGTGLTLAHTGKPIQNFSLAYEKEANIGAKPLEPSTTPELFIASLHNKIALLQVTTLRDGLHAHLSEKNPAELTPHEQQHLQDFHAPNYLETSLMPSLAIFNLAHEGDAPSHEFSPSTVKYLEGQLKRINDTSLEGLLANNQGHLEKGHFSTELSNWAEVKARVEK